MSGDESLGSDDDGSASDDKYFMISLYQSMQYLHITKLGEIIKELGERDVIGDQSYDEMMKHIRAIFAQASKWKDSSDDLFVTAFAMDAACMTELQNEAKVEANEQYSDLGWGSEIVTQSPSPCEPLRSTSLCDRDSERVDKSSVTKMLFHSSSNEKKHHRSSENTQPQKKRAKISDNSCSDSDTNDGHDMSLCQSDTPTMDTEQQEEEEVGNPTHQQRVDGVDEQMLQRKQLEKAATKIQAVVRGIQTRVHVEERKQHHDAVSAKAEAEKLAAKEATRVEKEEMERRAEEQRIEKERTDRERQRREVLKPWEDIQQSFALAKRDESTTRPLVAGETNLLGQLYTLIDHFFDTRNPERLALLPLIAGHFICLLGPIIEASHVVASHRMRDASKMASVFGKGKEASLGALLTCCDTTKNKSMEGENPAKAAELARIKKVICSYFNYKSETTLPKKVEEFVQLGHPTRNMLMHLFHLIIGYLVISELKLADAVAHLPNDVADAIIKKAADLARIVNRSAAFSSSMTILSYFNTFAFRGLDMADVWEYASQVVISILDSITNDSKSSKQVKAHREIVVEPHFKPKQNYTVSGRIIESGVDYCGGTDGAHTRKRKRIIRVIALQILKKSIMRRLQNDLNFDECGGFTRCLLRLSPTDIVSHFSFVNVEFFKDNYSIDSSEVEKFKGKVLKKQNPNDGERTLLIENDEQINSLKCLLDTFMDADENTFA